MNEVEIGDAVSLLFKVLLLTPPSI